MAQLKLIYTATTKSILYNPAMTGAQLRSTVASQFGIADLQSFHMIGRDTLSPIELFINPTRHGNAYISQIGISQTWQVHVILNMTEGSIMDPKQCPPVIWRFQDNSLQPGIPSVRQCERCKSMRLVDQEQIHQAKYCRILHCTCGGHYCWFCMEFDGANWGNLSCAKSPHSIYGRCPNSIAYNV